MRIGGRRPRENLEFQGCWYTHLSHSSIKLKYDTSRRATNHPCVWERWGGGMCVGVRLEESGRRGEGASSKKIPCGREGTNRFPKEPPKIPENLQNPPPQNKPPNPQEKKDPSIPK
ncbi:hypothetical protein AVEN_40354-1 [Araneus ventricosus]|uniref:Uncharacterized protein n=1 Tax=Araneus ventricosus TaxID=182803 RepID=A0A4Y2F500_ARAVE|nr:hypothetical protein AVEN_40354-1 [Araneus ventricosus]